MSRNIGEALRLFYIALKVEYADCQKLIQTIRSSHGLIARPAGSERPSGNAMKGTLKSNARRCYRHADGHVKIRLPIVDLTRPAIQASAIGEVCRCIRPAVVEKDMYTAIAEDLKGWRWPDSARTEGTAGTMAAQPKISSAIRHGLLF